MKRIIGLTGSFGSGCTTTARKLSEDGYEHISISSDILYPLALEVGAPFETREEKQLFGNTVRKKHKEKYKDNLLTLIRAKGDKVVIECIRNPIEIDLLRDTFPHFFLIAIYASSKTREQRTREKDFGDNDKRDEGQNDKHGQQVRKCVGQADIILDNSNDWIHGDDADEFFGKVHSYIELLKTAYRLPTHEETTMHLAYSASLHSSCLKRQVGAVITDSKYRVLSVGFNDVPPSSETCFDLHSRCYRAIKEQEHVQKLCQKITHCPFCGELLNFIEGLLEAEPSTLTKDSFLCASCHKNLSKLQTQKHLDFCRSLHAEENAILSNPFLSAKLFKDEMIIFTTTFPCMLCAKKISNSGIKKLVFVEPYPVIEAHQILEESGIEIKIFEGVKSLSFNRIFKNSGKYLKEKARERLSKLDTINKGD